MWPILFQIGPVTVYTYGLLWGLGFVLCVFLGRAWAREAGLAPNLITDAALWGLGAGIVGARLLDVIVHWREFVAAPLRVFNVWQGRSYIGGLLLAILAIHLVARRARVSSARVYDVEALMCLTAYAAGRVGCFFAGCCYGRACDLPWAVTFTQAHSLVPPSLRGVALHPTQLYSAATALLLLGFLLWFRSRKRFPGQIGLLFLIGYGISRFLIETVRGDAIRGAVIEGVLSTSQFVSLGLVLVALGFWVVLRRRRAGAEEPS